MAGWSSGVEECRRTNDPETGAAALLGRRVETGLLLSVLLSLDLGVEFSGVAILHGHAQCLLQELAGLAALGAGVTLGLHGGLPRGRNGDLDNAGHQSSSRWVISRSMRAMERCSRSTRWKALRNRIIQGGQGRSLIGPLLLKPTEAILPSGVGGRCSRRRADEPSSGLGHRSAPFADGQPDAAVRERLFADLQALLAGLDTAPLDRVGLEEAVQVGLLTPAALKVVVAHRSRECVDYGGALPAGQRTSARRRVAALAAGC